MADKETKIKVRFLAERIVRDHDNQIIDHFKPGQVKVFSENSARHWLSRGLAEEIEGAAQETRRGKRKAPEAEASDPDSGAERKAPPPTDPMTHADHPAVAAATGKAG